MVKLCFLNNRWKVSPNLMKLTSLSLVTLIDDMAIHREFYSQLQTSIDHFQIKDLVPIVMWAVKDPM